MSSIQIADKTTLDNIDTNTTNLLSKGGIRYNTNSSKYQTYNTNTNTWIDTEFGGGGGNPTLIVKNYNNLFNNKNITVYNNDFNYTETKNMSTNTYLTFEVPYLGEYTVNYDSKSKNVSINSFGGISCNLISFTSFSDASIEDIDNLLTLHYNDILNIMDIWSIGDKRTVSLSAMSATGVGESHVAQDVEFEIIGFDHDDLVTPINNHTKAAITLNQVNCLNEPGYMNSKDSSRSAWMSCPRRTWCNDIYYNALPSNFKSLIKQVKIITATDYATTATSTTEDYCWILAEKEVAGRSYYSNDVESYCLIQYPYYKTISNRIKYRNESTAAFSWWERSPHMNNSRYYTCCSSNAGTASQYASWSYATSLLGLAPALCL